MNNRLQALVSEAKSITIYAHRTLPTICITTGSKLFGTEKKHNFSYDLDGKAIRKYAGEYGKAIEIVSKNEKMSREEILLLREVRKALYE